MNCANVGMVQSRSGLRFTAKAAQDLSIFGHFVGQKLQRNKAIEFGVLGFEYHAHPAGAQRLDYAIVQDGFWEVGCGDYYSQYMRFESSALPDVDGSIRFINAKLPAALSCAPRSS